MMELKLPVHVNNVRRASARIADAHKAVTAEMANHAERHRLATDKRRKATEIQARVDAGISAINNKV